MRAFKSLAPEDIPADFDSEIQGVSPIVKVKELKDTIVVTYAFPGFHLVDDVRQVDNRSLDFKQVNIKGVGFLAESGKPLLPSFGRYLSIPYHSDYQVKVEKGKAVQFDDVFVLPAQQKLTDKPKEKQVFEFDREMYNTEGLYPEEVVKVTGPHTIDDYTALLIHVVPFQYNAKKRILMGYGNIKITFVFKRKTDVDLRYPMVDAETNKEAFGNLFLNPRRRIEDRLELGPVAIPVPPLKLQGPVFLIIHHDNFKNAALALAKWKNKRGLSTETVSISKVGNSVDKIKSYIRGRRMLSPRLRYVLLFGDKDHITPEDISPSPSDPNITDYYYSTQKDPTGSTDYVFPWLSIGRIPVQTEAEANDVVRQIIAYERTPPADSSYYQRMLFAAFFQENQAPGQPGYGRDDRGYLKTIEDIRAFMANLGYDTERVYVTSNPNPQFYNDGTPIPAAVIAAFMSEANATNRLVAATTEGQLLIAHRDHGDSPGWSHPSFTVSDLNNVSGDMPSIFYSINCLTGKYDLAATKQCFAEKSLIMPGAAPSLIAATRLSHTWLNNDLLKGLFDGSFGGLLPTFPGGTASYPVKNNRLGDLLNYGKSYLPVGQSGDAASIKDHFEIYHVFGDPTLELWREMPRIIRVKANLVGPRMFISMSSCPQGSSLTFWHGGILIKQITPTSTRLLIDLTGIAPLAAPHDVTVCFWAPGCRYTEVKIA
jgi:hypothetical protein